MLKNCADYERESHGIIRSSTFNWFEESDCESELESSENKEISSKVVFINFVPWPSLNHQSVPIKLRIKPDDLALAMILRNSCLHRSLTAWSSAIEIDIRQFVTFFSSSSSTSSSVRFKNIS